MKKYARHLLLSFCVLLAGLLVAACEPADGEGAEPRITSVTAELAPGVGGDDILDIPNGNGQTPTPSPTGAAPTLTPGASVGEPVRISVEVDNFDIVGEVGDNEGDGYFIYYLDRIPQIIRQAAGPAGQQLQEQQDGRQFESTETDFVWENITPGLHIFSVQVVDTSGNPLGTPAAAVVVINVPLRAVATVTPVTVATPTQTLSPTLVPTTP